MCYSTKNCNILKDIGGGFLMYNAKPFETAFGYTMKDSDEDFYGDGTLDYVSIFVGNDSQGTPWILTKDGYDSVYQFQKGANSNYDGSLPDTIYQKID